MDPGASPPRRLKPPTPPMLPLEMTPSGWRERVASHSIAFDEESSNAPVSHSVASDETSDTSDHHSASSDESFADFYACPREKTSQVGMDVFSDEKKEALTEGLHFIETSTQDEILSLVRHLLDSGIWGDDLGKLHDVTLFHFCRKLGFTSTQCKSRTAMEDVIRHVRENQKWVPTSDPRTWYYLKQKYGENFG